MPAGSIAVRTATIIPESERTAVFGRGTLRAAADHRTVRRTGLHVQPPHIQRCPRRPFPQGDTANQVPILYPAADPTIRPPSPRLTASAATSICATARCRSARASTRTTSRRGAPSSARTASRRLGLRRRAQLQPQRPERPLVSGYVSAQRIVSDGDRSHQPIRRFRGRGRCAPRQHPAGGEIHSAKGTTLDLLVKGSRQIDCGCPAGRCDRASGAEAGASSLKATSRRSSPRATCWSIPVAVQSAGGSRDRAGAVRRSERAVRRGLRSPACRAFRPLQRLRQHREPQGWRCAGSRCAACCCATSWGTGFQGAAALRPVHAAGADLPAHRQGPTALPRDRQLPATARGFPRSLAATRTFSPRPRSSSMPAWSGSRRAACRSTLDYWRISKSNLIGHARPADDLRQPGHYGPTNVIRGPVDPQYPDLPGPIDDVVLTNQNLGNLVTVGHRLRLRLARPGDERRALQLRAQRHLHRRVEDADGRAGLRVGGRPQSADGVGRFPAGGTMRRSTGATAPGARRWRRTIQSGYEDVNAPPSACRIRLRRARLRATPSGICRPAMPASKHHDRARREEPVRPRPAVHEPAVLLQVGYDPGYADPRGRAFYARLTYAFD